MPHARNFGALASRHLPRFVSRDNKDRGLCQAARVLSRSSPIAADIRHNETRRDVAVSSQIRVDISVRSRLRFLTNEKFPISSYLDRTVRD